MNFNSLQGPGHTDRMLVLVKYFLQEGGKGGGEGRGGGERKKKKMKEKERVRKKKEKKAECARNESESRTCTWMQDPELASLLSHICASSETKYSPT